MRTRTLPFLVLLALLLGFVAACGDGGGQQGGGEQGGGEQQGEGDQQQGGEQQQGGGEQQAGEAEAQGPAQAKVALGTIESVDPESRRVVLKPDFEAQGDQLTFNVRKNAEISVNDQEAELSEVQSGRSAQVEYVTKNDVNRALSVEVVGDGG